MAKKYESVTNVQKRDVHLLDSFMNKQLCFSKKGGGNK